MKVRFYQVFVMKGAQTFIRLGDTYKIKSGYKITESECEGLYILTLNYRKRRLYAKRHLILSKIQYEQLQDAQNKGMKCVTIKHLYSNSDLNRILKYWVPTSIRLYKAAQFGRDFHVIRSYVMSNLGGEFHGKFLLPTPFEETFDIPRIIQACIDGRK